MLSTALPIVPSLAACQHCSTGIVQGSKFCGNCGIPTVLPIRMGPNARYVEQSLSASGSSSASVVQASNDLNTKAAQYLKGTEGAAAAARVGVPSFARNKKHSRPIPPEMQAEMAGLMAGLVRENIFLVGHYMIFLVTNLIGLWIAVKCFVEFNGDELSKLMMASTPLMFINLTALTALVPIKGTKREIARINERMTYLKLAMELDHII